MGNHSLKCTRMSFFFEGLVSSIILRYSIFLRFISSFSDEFLFSLNISIHQCHFIFTKIFEGCVKKIKKKKVSFLWYRCLVIIIIMVSEMNIFRYLG